MMVDGPRERSVRYANRYEAGKVLARHLIHLVGRPDVVVLGLPRGGVPVASEIAQALGAPLDIFVVRRLGVPGHREVAMGAIASGGIRMLDRELIEALGLAWPDIDAVTREEQVELARRERIFRNGRRPLSVTNRAVVLADDGLATGSTMRAAIQAVRALKPAEVIVAVPVASASARDDLCALADQVVCPLVPPLFRAVGEWYDDFSDIADSEVRGLLGLPAEVQQLTYKSADRSH
jgi:putative phosphoribosyl transferase